MIGVRAKSFKVSDTRTSDYTLSVMVRCQFDGFTQVITTVYGPNHSEDRQSFWDELRGIKAWQGHSIGHLAVTSMS